MKANFLIPPPPLHHVICKLVAFCTTFLQERVQERRGAAMQSIVLPAASYRDQLFSIKSRRSAGIWWRHEQSNYRTDNGGQRSGYRPLSCGLVIKFGAHVSAKQPNCPRDAFVCTEKWRDKSLHDLQNDCISELQDCIEKSGAVGFRSNCVYEMFPKNEISDRINNFRSVSCLGSFAREGGGSYTP
jgi:hypothetical protein